MDMPLKPNVLEDLARDASVLVTKTDSSTGSQRQRQERSSTLLKTQFIWRMRVDG